MANDHLFQILLKSKTLQPQGEIFSIMWIEIDILCLVSYWLVKFHRT